MDETLSRTVIKAHHGVVSRAMWESDRRAARTTSYGWTALLLGLVVALAQTTLVAQAWQTCKISGATGLTTTSLYALGVPTLTFLNWLLIALPAEVWLGKRNALFNRWVMTIATSAVLLAAETLVVGYYVATPSEPVGSSCSDNVPDWWPERFPV